MHLAHTIIPVVNMRESPANDSKVVSQSIISEVLIVRKQGEEWSLVETPDKYVGFVPNQSFLVGSSYCPNLKTCRLAALVYEIPDIEYGPLMAVPYGTSFSFLEKSCSRWIKIALPSGKEAYIQSGDVEEEKSLDKHVLPDFAKTFEGLPYTWGGRSSFGFDCSGFVQMLYKQIGIGLPRDSCTQVIDKRFKSISVDEISRGDLVFFGKSENEILHVGMAIGEGAFIHATSRENMPWIRVSCFCDAEWNGSKQAHYCYRIAKTLNF